MNNLSKYFKNLSEENKLTHSYLIGNVTFDDIKEELFKVINKYFFNSKLDLENNPDLYILRPDEKGTIKKERVKDLISEVTYTSQFNDKKVYIIENTESLNDFSYNALLKTIEEPSENVYAFLLTKNTNAVKPTIVSRCQKIFVSSNTKEEFSEDIINLGNSLIEIIETSNIESYGKQYSIYNKIEDRNILKEVLEYLLEEYFNILNKKSENNSIKDNSVDSLARKILVINNNINNLNYYLNKNLSIDRFLIEMWRC